MVATPEPSLNDRLHTIARDTVTTVWKRTTELAKKNRKLNMTSQQRAMSHLLDNLRKELQMSLVKDFGWLSMQVGKKAREVYARQLEERLNMLLDQAAKIAELETQLAETQQRLNNALED